MAVDQKELAARLRQARDQAGLTQEKVATAVGLPRPSIVEIEAGRRAVTGIELDRLAALYDADVRKLLQSDAAFDVIAHFRRDELAEMPDLVAALDETLRLGRELAELEQLAGGARDEIGPAAYEPGLPANVAAAEAQGRRAAEAERARLAFGDAPIEDMVDLLEAAGVRTALLEMPAGVSGLMLIDPSLGPLIAVNRAHHVLRRNFSLAHELAHLLFDRGAGAVVSRQDEQANLRETRANAFASTFLMPEAGIRRRLAELGKPTEASGGWRAAKQGRGAAHAERIEVHDLVLLAHVFRVSRAAMLHRLRALRIISGEQQKVLQEEDAMSGLAVARLLALREPEHVEERARFARRFVRLALEAFGRGRIDEAKLATHLSRDGGLSNAQVKEFLKRRRAEAGVAKPTPASRKVKARS